MTTTARPGTRRRGMWTYALTDGTGDRRRSYVLEPGLNRIGSLPESNVRLDVRGVSKRHALLVADGETLSLDDLASKNGTFRNGTRIETTIIEPGDMLRFGPATLRLERLTTHDGELAIALSKDSSVVMSRVRHDTSHLVGPKPSPDRVDWTGFIESFAERLPPPGGGLSRALRWLIEALDAAGVALVECLPSGPLVRASCGSPPGGIPADAMAAVRGLRSGRRSAVSGAGAGPPWVLVTWARPPAAPLALTVWGEFALREQCEPLLRVLLTLCCRSVSSSESLQDRVPARGLRFPSGWVRGESTEIEELYRRLRAVVASDLPILILGETGVGKEGMARLIHESSARRHGPFVAINCAAIPRELLEAELFGIGRGVATGVDGRQGTIEQAQGGTLFLDEIGDMSAGLQSKLLRALQEREIQPVGGRPRSVDVRVVAATNVDLPNRVEKGDFRQDLFYRLTGFIARIPALRHRRADIPALVEHFLCRTSKEAGKSIRGLTLEALRRLVERPWPGNVRELEHEVRRLVYLCSESQPITSVLLAEVADIPAENEIQGLDFCNAPSLDLAAIERCAVAEALARTGGNRSRAAPLLGISREALRRRIVRHGV